VECGEGKHVFIKYHIAVYIDPAGFDLKAFVSFVKGAITKKNTLCGAKGKLLSVVGPKIRPTRTPEDAQGGVVGFV
jgi:hypothetical protein